MHKLGRCTGVHKRRRGNHPSAISGFGDRMVRSKIEKSPIGRVPSRFFSERWFSLPAKSHRHWQCLIWSIADLGQCSISTYGSSADTDCEAMQPTRHDVTFLSSGLSAIERPRTPKEPSCPAFDALNSALTPGIAGLAASPQAMDLGLRWASCAVLAIGLFYMAYRIRTDIADAAADRRQCAVHSVGVALLIALGSDSFQRLPRNTKRGRHLSFTPTLCLR